LFFLRKIINEKELNKSTLQALQEEQERKQRLQDYQLNNSFDGNTKNINKFILDKISFKI
jgi:hypothetical protein